MKKLTLDDYMKIFNDLQDDKIRTEVNALRVKNIQDGFVNIDESYYNRVFNLYKKNAVITGDMTPDGIFQMEINSFMSEEDFKKETDALLKMMRDSLG